MKILKKSKIKPAWIGALLFELFWLGDEDADRLLAELEPPAPSPRRLFLVEPIEPGQVSVEFIKAELRRIGGRR